MTTSNLKQIFMVGLSKKDFKFVVKVLEDIDRNVGNALVELCKRYKVKK